MHDPLAIHFNNFKWKLHLLSARKVSFDDTLVRENIVLGLVFQKWDFPVKDFSQLN